MRIRLAMRYELLDGCHSSIRRVTDLYHGRTFIETIRHLQDVPEAVMFWQAAYDWFDSFGNQ